MTNSGNLSAGAFGFNQNVAPNSSTNMFPTSANSMFASNAAAHNPAGQPCADRWHLLPLANYSVIMQGSIFLVLREIT